MLGVEEIAGTGVCSVPSEEHTPFYVPEVCVFRLFFAYFVCVCVCVCVCSCVCYVLTALFMTEWLVWVKQCFLAGRQLPGAMCCEYNGYRLVDLLFCFVSFVFALLSEPIIRGLYLWFGLLLQ